MASNETMSFFLLFLAGVFANSTNPEIWRSGIQEKEGRHFRDRKRPGVPLHFDRDPEVFSLKGASKSNDFGWHPPVKCSLRENPVTADCFAREDSHKLQGQVLFGKDGAQSTTKKSNQQLRTILWAGMSLFVAVPASSLVGHSARDLSTLPSRLWLATKLPWVKIPYPQ